MHNVSAYARAYRNKITNKVFGVVSIPTTGKRKGYALLSYMTGPFTLTPGEHFTDPHIGYWESALRARLLSERGYAVDIINGSDKTFIPKKPYKVVIDIRQNLERLSPYLPKDCIKIMHITSAPGTFQNAEEQKRLANLKERRGVAIAPTRYEIVSGNEQFADYLEGFGNKTVHATYKVNKPITPIPYACTETFPFPEGKDFAETRKEFLWFGGGGAVLKGLDLLIEAFAPLTHLGLTIIGPAAFEKEFEGVYEKELALPHIKRYQRPQINKNGESFVEGVPLIDMFNRCATTIFPSASEGAGGSVVQTMQAGVIPAVTRNTGIWEDAPAIIIEDPTVKSIQIIAEHISQAPPEELRAHARKVWQYAQTHNTRGHYIRAYESFLDTIVKL